MVHRAFTLLGCTHALLLATASTDLPDANGRTALQHGEAQGRKATTTLQAEAKGHPAVAELIRRHAAPPQPAAAMPATPPDASEPAVSSAASLPLEILQSAERGELRNVVEWLRKGVGVDALGSVLAADDRTTTIGLLHAAAANDHLEMVRELLKRGASVDLPTSLGNTALMGAAYHGHLSILLVWLQHSANPDLQANNGQTALMMAARQGHGACVQALLRAKAGTELLHMNGFTALKFAKAEGHAPIAELIRQHAVPTQPAAPPKASEATWSSVAPLPEEILATAAADSAGWVRRAAGGV